MSQRSTRVSELIRRELSTILERKYAFKDKFVTVHETDTAPDLKNCTVFIGILGGKEYEREDIIAKLNKDRGHIQRELYKRVILKSSPQLYFKLDNSAERGVTIVNLIEQLPTAAAETDEPLGNFVGEDGLDHRWEEKEVRPTED